MQNILSMSEKSKTDLGMSLVEGVISSNVFSNVTYSGFIVKYDS